MEELKSISEASNSIEFSSEKSEDEFQFQHSNTNTSEVLHAYHAKEYERCLNLITKLEKEVSEPLKSSQLLIIKAACWTLLDLNLNETFELLTQVIKHEPENSLAYYGLGLVQYKNADLIGCIESFSAAVEFNASGDMKRAMDLMAKAQTLSDLITNGECLIEIK